MASALPPATPAARLRVSSPDVLAADPPTARTNAATMMMLCATGGEHWRINIQAVD